MKPLSDKPSEFFRQVAGDFKVQAQLVDTIDMGSWVRSKNNKICSVCLAGAVMAESFKEATTKALREMGEVIPEELISSMPESETVGVHSKLHFLNVFRLGSDGSNLLKASYFVESFGEPIPDKLTELTNEMPKYRYKLDNEDVAELHEYLLIAADICEEAGL